MHYKSKMAKQNKTKQQSLRSCKSMFATTVNSRRVLADLNKLIASTTKVQGMLTIVNIHRDPFAIICNRCNFPADTFGTISCDQLHFSICNQPTSYRHCLQLQCIIQTDTNTQYECILKNSLLVQLCSSLKDLTYEKYLEDITYNLRDFHIHGNFILDNVNVILHTR